MRKNVIFTGDMLKDWFASKAKQFSDKFTKTSTKARYHSHERSGGRRGQDKTDLGLDTALAENERDTLLREQQDVKEAIQKQDQCKSTRWELHLNVNSIISKNNWMHKLQFLYLSLSLHSAIHGRNCQRWAIFASLHTSKMLFFEK